MISTRWEEVKRVFEAALLQEEDKQDWFVLQLSSGDSEVSEAVFRLLAADRESGNFLEPDQFLTASVFPVSAPEREASLEGAILCDRFEILSYLGEGGMGRVYRAVDLELQQELAIKTIRRDIADTPGMLSRFKREVNATRKVTHPNVCRTFDLETHQPSEKNDRTGPPPITFLTMELLEGETLAQRISRQGPLPQKYLRALAEQVIRALQAVHSVGIVHCDLKPSNIFWTGPENDPRFVVTDFGIARQVAPAMTTTSTILPGEGTPFYMAPEQLEQGKCSVASDIYSYGLVLYEALTGCRLSPYLRTESDIEKAIFNRDSGAGTVDEDGKIWINIIARCVRPDPCNRFGNIEEILELLKCGSGDLSDLISATATTSETLASLARDETRRIKWRSFHRNPFVAVLAVTGVICSIFLWRFNHEHEVAPPDYLVAVLPIALNGNNLQLHSIADDVTSSLTSELAQMSDIRVLSEDTIRSLGANAPTPQALRKVLHINSLVSGKIEMNGNDEELQMELTDARTGFQIWAQSYSKREMGGSSLGADIALEIAYQLRVRNNNSSSQKSVAQHSIIPAAEEAFRQGQIALQDHTYTGFERAARLFQQAIDADPGFAKAIAQLSLSYTLMAINNSRPEPPFALMSQAEDTARRALRLDSSLVEAYASLAEIQLLRDYNWPEAETNFKRAEEIDPTYVPGHVSYALHLLTPNGRFAEARVQFAYADKETPKSLRTSLAEATGSYFSRQFQKSISDVETARNEFHSSAVAIEIEALDYMATGSPAKAMRVLVDSPPDPSAPPALRDALRGVALVQLGRRSEATTLLKHLEQSTENNFNSNYYIAALSAKLGYNTKALAYLEKSRQERQTSVLFLGVDPLMDALRSDPRFKELLSTLNLH